MSFFGAILGGKALADGANAINETGYANARAITAESAAADAEARLAQQAKAAEQSDEVAMAAIGIFAETRNAMMSAAAVTARIRADEVGLRTLTRELLAIIRQAAPSNSLLDRKVRDRIFGEAAGASMESNNNSEFSSEIAFRAGMLAIVDTLAKEVAMLAPEHTLNSSDERHYIYWVARELEFEKLHGNASFDEIQKKVTSDDHKNAAFTNPAYADTESEVVQTRLKQRHFVQ